MAIPTARNSKDKGCQREILTRPGNAEPLAGPEHAKGRQHNADAELQRVLGHPRERLVDGDADGEDDQARRQRAEPGGPQKTATGADGDDDEHDLKPFEQHRLECGQTGDPIE